MKRLATRNGFLLGHTAVFDLGVSAKRACLLDTVSADHAASSLGSLARLLATIVRMKRERARSTPL